MPTHPLSDETLHLIDAVRLALSHRSDVEERPLFGTHAFFVNGKMCLAVKGEELLVRLPPGRHDALQEMQNTRELSPGGGMKGYFWVEPNGYATREQWNYWVQEALAYNPLAKASQRKKVSTLAAGSKPLRNTAKKDVAGEKKHSIFEAED